MSFSCSCTLYGRGWIPAHCGREGLLIGGIQFQYMVLYRGTSNGFLCDNKNPLEGATFFSRPHSDNTLSSKIDWWSMTDSPILPSVWILSPWSQRRFLSLQFSWRLRSVIALRHGAWYSHSLQSVPRSVFASATVYTVGLL